ncbi:IgGFc-binding protein [Nannocystaceae bacterium ST9]
MSRLASLTPTLLPLITMLACRAGEGSNTTDEVGDGDGDGIETSSSAGESSSDASESSSDDPSSDSTDADADSTDADDGIKFDLPILPDAGGGPVLPTIPETCAQALMIESTVGCSFHANKMQNFQEEPTSLVVGNVSDENPATLQLYFGPPGGGEQAVGGPIMIPPGGTHEFVLNMPGEPGDVSVLRQGGAHRVESDRPVVAYQHSPISAVAHNDSSMLIPDHALGQNYIVAAWSTNIGNDYSYFNVVGIEENTTVEWQPRNATAAGSGVPAVGALATGMVVIGAYDMLQVTASSDVSGTIISTSEPAWVVGAVPCVNIPANVTYCDHIEELMLPLEYWGEQYVGAHAPQRGNEDYWWRIYSGDDAVTITTDPPQPGTPALLDRGEFIEFSTQQSFIATADGPFLPVQYLEGQDGGAGTGDPASYQMVPTEQFLPRYVFVTGTGYDENYVQITRPQGGADVLVDGAVVTGYYAVGEFEVADWSISQGAHVAESDDAFGVIQVGYTDVTSYAYPGGLRLAKINPNPQG